MGTWSSYGECTEASWRPKAESIDNHYVFSHLLLIVFFCKTYHTLFICMFYNLFLPVLCHTLIQALFYFYLTLDLTFITLLLLPSDTWNMPFDSSIGGQSALFIHIILFPFKQICCTFFAISFSLKEGVSQEAGWVNHVCRRLLFSSKKCSNFDYYFVLDFLKNQVFLNNW